MKLREVNTNAIIAEYKKADKAGKELLTRLYGKEMFIEKNMTSLAAFEEACKIDGIKPSDVLRFSNPKNAYEEGKNAEDMLDQLYKIKVGEYEPNWNDGNTKKWVPVFLMGAAFRFDYAHYGWAYTFTIGGSRLWFPTEGMATEFGKQHEDLYKKIANMGKRK